MSTPIPYVKGLSEEIKRTFAAHGAGAYFKHCNTIRQLVSSPKDPIKKEEVCGPVYRIKCEGVHGVDCDSVYIGETERTLKTRFAEHRRPSSVTSEVSKHVHKDCPGHNILMENVQILDRDARWFERGVKESIYIRANKPDLNRDAGRNQLPTIWDNLIRSRVKPARDRQS